MPDRPTECVVCGFPVFRQGGHAEWCERIRAFNRDGHLEQPHPDHGDHRLYRRGCRCGPCRRANTAYRRDLAARHALEAAT